MTAHAMSGRPRALPRRRHGRLSLEADRSRARCSRWSRHGRRPAPRPRRPTPAPPPTFDEAALRRRVLRRRRPDARCRLRVFLEDCPRASPPSGTAVAQPRRRGASAGGARAEGRGRQPVGAAGCSRRRGPRAARRRIADGCRRCRLARCPSKPHRAWTCCARYAASDAGRRRMRILIADDDRMSTMMLVAALEPVGTSTWRSSHDGTAAWEALSGDDAAGARHPRLDDAGPRRSRAVPAHPC